MEWWQEAVNIQVGVEVQTKYKNKINDEMGIKSEVQAISRISSIFIGIRLHNDRQTIYEHAGLWAENYA